MELFLNKRTMEKITVLGHELLLAFNMAAQIEFEELSGQPFGIETLGTQKATMQLCYAALKVSNESVPFTFEEMIRDINVEDTAAIKNAVTSAMNAWYKIPDVIEQQPASEDGGKN